MHMGESESGTLGGGALSIGLKGLIFTYLCIRMIAVISFKDPAIASYVIYEDRSKMHAPLNLAENN